MRPEGRRIRGGNVNSSSWFREIIGQYPYPYQALLVTSGDLSDLLSIPTGAGKTAAIVLGWLFKAQDLLARGLRLRTCDELAPTGKRPGSWKRAGQ